MQHANLSIHVLLKSNNTERINRSNDQQQGPSINIFPTTLQYVPTVPGKHMIELDEGLHGLRILYAS